MAANTLYAHKQNAILIQTPEGVAFSLLLAGPISRMLALWLDNACIGIVMILLQILFLLFGIISLDISYAVFILLFFIINIFYSILFEWFWHGQTIGKKIFGLRVMDARGLQLQPSQVVIRNLLRAVDSIPMFYLFGGVASLLTRYSQRLGDMAANTVVVTVPKIEKPQIDLIIEPNYFNSLRGYPHLAARLRQKTAPEEANFALQSLLRRNDLIPDARLDLFHNLSEHFKQKVSFPREILTGISDEQYVRNVVDLVFRG